MVQDLFRFKESASQTAGPYVHIGCTPNFSGIKGVFPSDLGSAMFDIRALGLNRGGCAGIQEAD